MGGAIECPLCGNNQAYCKCTRLEKEQFLEIERLRQYAIVDARCPCCEQTDKCLDDCTFSADWPAGAQRTAAARAAIGVKSKQEGR